MWKAARHEIHPHLHLRVEGQIIHHRAAAERALAGAGTPAAAAAAEVAQLQAPGHGGSAKDVRALQGRAWHRSAAVLEPSGARLLGALRMWPLPSDAPEAPSMLAAGAGPGAQGRPSHAPARLLRAPAASCGGLIRFQSPCRA